MKKPMLAVAVVCLMLAPLYAQVTPHRQNLTGGTSGVVLTATNPRGSAAQSFEYVITGSPATASIVLKGCMSSGTCDTIETSTATTSSNRSFNFNYDYFTITPTFTGGSTPTLAVNTLFSEAGTPQRGDIKGINVHGSTGGFSCVVTVSTATTIQAFGGSCAAPGAGLSLYITDISLSASAAGIAADAFPTIKYGTGGTCGTATGIAYGVLSAAAVAGFVGNFATPIKIPANNELCWISSTAGSKFLVVNGFIAP